MRASWVDEMRTPRATGIPAECAPPFAGFHLRAVVWSQQRYWLRSRGERPRFAQRSFAIKPTRTAHRSPWQNGVAERWIGSVRRELLDHVVVFGEGNCGGS
jgi:hypothetical protein